MAYSYKTDNFSETTFDVISVMIAFQYIMQFMALTTLQNVVSALMWRIHVRKKENLSFLSGNQSRTT